MPAEFQPSPSMSLRTVKNVWKQRGLKKKKKQETNHQYSVQGEEKICWRRNTQHDA